MRICTAKEVLAEVVGPFLILGRIERNLKQNFRVHGKVIEDFEDLHETSIMGPVLFLLHRDNSHLADCIKRMHSFWFESSGAALNP